MGPRVQDWLSASARMALLDMTNYKEEFLFEFLPLRFGCYFVSLLKTDPVAAWRQFSLRVNK